MKLSCPHCGQQYDIGESYIGKGAECTNCGKHFILNAEMEPSEPEQTLTVIHCPYCGGEISSGVKKCRHCGEWLNSNDKPKNPVLYVLLAFFFGMLGIHNLYSGAKGKGWVKLIMLFGAVPASIIISIPFSLLSVLLTSSNKTGMGIGSGALAFFIVPCIWIASAIWNIVEMFHCREEIEKGAVEISSKHKRILKWISIILGFVYVIGLMTAIITSCRLAVSPPVSYSKEQKTSVLPPRDVIQKGEKVLNRLDELAQVRKHRELTISEKKEACELFSYMIDEHTVICNDDDGRRIMENKRREWGL